MRTIPSFPKLKTVIDSTLFPESQAGNVKKVKAENLKNYVMSPAEASVTAIQAAISTLNSTMSTRLRMFYERCALSVTPRTTEAKTFQDITYSPTLNLWCAVNSSGTTTSVATSPDGITWTARTTTALSWNGVAWGNGVFVICAITLGTASIQTSPDGITWTTRTTPNGSWQKVVFANGLFVACGGTGGSGVPCIMTSPDGITWTSRAVPAIDPASLVSIAYNNGNFCAVGWASSNPISIVSSDGISWFSGIMPGNNWHKIMAGPDGSFLCLSYQNLGFGGGSTAYSLNGLDWIEFVGLPMAYWSTGTYGNGIFCVVFVRGTKNYMTVSLDGGNWSTPKVMPGVSAGWRGIAWACDQFVICGTNSTSAILTSLKRI